MSFLSLMAFSCQGPLPTANTDTDYIEFESVWQYCKTFSIYQDSSAYEGRIPRNPFEFAEPDDIMAAIGDTLFGARYTRYDTDVSAAFSGDGLIPIEPNSAAGTVSLDTLTDSTALITITVFAGNTYGDFLKSIVGAGGFANFIIDVRHNYGGYLDVLDSIVEALVPSGTGYILARERDYDAETKKSVTLAWHPWTAGNGPLLTFDKKRFIVLMDAHSASASEILVAALYEGGRGPGPNGRVPLLGVKSYGKGIGQIPIARRTRKGLLITCLQLKGISSRIGDYHRRGIAPDTVPQAIIAEADTSSIPEAEVNRLIFCAAKLFEPSLKAGDIVFPPKRIFSGDAAPATGLYKVVSEDEVRLPVTRPR